MSWSHDEAAQRMGMPVHEILAVAEVGDCHVVTTHDGQRTVVTADGATEPYVEPVPDEDDEPGVDADGDGVVDDTNGDGAPDGTAEQVLAWVGDDAGRAATALATEQARDRPRSVLTAQLEKLVGE